MTKSAYRRPALFFLLAAGMLAMAELGIMVFPAAAQDAVPGKPSPLAENPIRITAEQLITDTQNKTAEFTGHVSAIQDDTTITCDKLTVYYRDASGSEPETAAGMNAIVRIVAQGAVKMILDDRVAYTEHAEYIADKKVVVLTGPSSKIVQGNNSIAGQKITLYRDDGRIHVSGTQKEPVEAFFYSDENGLAVTKKKK